MSHYFESLEISVNKRKYIYFTINYQESYNTYGKFFCTWNIIFKNVFKNIIYKNFCNKFYKNKGLI